MEKPRSIGGLILVQFAKTNFLLSGWICIVLGASISIAIPDAIGLTISFPLGIAGIILLIIGIRNDPEERVNIEEMRSWQPEEGPGSHTPKAQARRLVDRPWHFEGREIWFH